MYPCSLPPARCQTAGLLTPCWCPSHPVIQSMRNNIDTWCCAMMMIWWSRARLSLYDGIPLHFLIFDARMGCGATRSAEMDFRVVLGRAEARACSEYEPHSCETGDAGTGLWLRCRVCSISAVSAVSAEGKRLRQLHASFVHGFARSDTDAVPLYCWQIRMHGSIRQNMGADINTRYYRN